MRKRSFNFLFALLFVIVCFEMQAIEARAQIVSGTIKDSQNAVVANAKIMLLSQNAIVSQTNSDAEGKFSLVTNGAQNLRLQIKAANFSNYEKALIDNLAQGLEIVLSPRNVNESVNVSIERAETRLSDTPSSVVVLNRETLDQTPAQTVDDALRQVPGFALFRRTSSRTANPTAQGTSLRGVGGSGASRAAVLLDGVSLNDAFGGWTYWSRVPRVAIEQTEVLRGGASALYGTGALSGAINVLTKKAANNKPVLRVETSGGTQNTFDGGLFTAYAKKGWAGSLALENFETKGYIPVLRNERGQADAPANSRHHTTLLTLERRFSENTRIFGRGNFFAEHRDNGTNLQKNRTFYRQAVLGGDFKHQALGSFALRSFLETQIYDQSFSAISVDRNRETLSRLQRVPSQAVGANLFWNRVFADTHTVSAAVETREVRGFSDETIYNPTRAASTVGAGGKERDLGVFAQDFWQISQKLNLNLGARFDLWRNLNALATTRSLNANGQTTVISFPARRQTAFSPRVAAIYQATDKLALTASFTRSFRAPTLNELYRAFRVGNVLTAANENLQAERANDFEAGARYAFFENKFNFRGNVFWIDVSNPIVNVTLANTPNLIARRRQNLGKTRSRGVELDFETNVRADLKISGGYLLADARVTDFPINSTLSGKLLPQIARHQIALSAFYNPPTRFSFGLQTRASSAQFDDDQNVFRLRPLFTVDVLVAYQLRKDLQIFVAAENVFNNRYDVALTPIKNVAAPAFLRVGLRFNLTR